MPRNIEIKARISDIDKVHAAASEISDTPPELILQEDVFFHTDTGRLKLRYLSPSFGQLIFYTRENKAGPKTSTYQIHETSEPDSLRAILSNAFGEKIIVKKRRHLYLSGRTRIHVDEVEELGNFIELEVVLQDADDPDGDFTEARKLMKQLDIRPTQLVEGAYADLLSNARTR